MKKLTLFAFIIMSTACLNYAMAQEGEESAGGNLKWGGYVKTDNRMRLQSEGEDKHRFSFHEYRLDLKINAQANENIHIFSEVWLRSIGFTGVQNSMDLSDKDKVSPWNMDVREAYVDIYGFIIDDVDIRIGRQRVAWGTGDKLNPTDNINSDDLEDIWDFGRHLGSDAIKITGYFGNVTLSGIYIPIFTPAVMPSDNWTAALSPSMELLPGMIIGSMSDNIFLPENNLKESSRAGIKAATNILDFDMSLSYVYGKDDIPLVNKVVLAAGAGPYIVNIESELIYPRVNIAGIDLAGSLFDIGIWAEAAIFFPQNVAMIVDLSSLGILNQESLVLDEKEPYTKYIIGADYTFKNGMYINCQYLHGFVHERGRDNLEDYIMFGLEWKLFNEKIIIIPIQGGVEVKDFGDIKHNYALIYSPELKYYPYDNIELTLGAHIIDGKDTTTFGKVKGLDELFLMVKGSF